jgi:hypothetical protein
MAAPWAFHEGPIPCPVSGIKDFFTNAMAAPGKREFPLPGTSPRPNND